MIRDRIASLNRYIARVEICDGERRLSYDSTTAPTPRELANELRHIADRLEQISHD